MRCVLRGEEQIKRRGMRVNWKREYRWKAHGIAQTDLLFKLWPAHLLGIYLCF